MKIEDMDWQSKLNRKNLDYSMLRSEADKLATIAKFYASNARF